MIKRTPALVALIAAATLAAGCADAVDGAPSGRTMTPLSTGGPTAFPSTVDTDPAGTPSAASVSPSTAQASASSAVPSSSYWSLATARRNYLTYVAPYNSAIKVLNGVVTSKSSTASDYRAGCLSVARAQAYFSDRLLAGQWPAGVRPALIEFIPLIEKSMSGFEACAASTSVKQAQAAIQQTPDTATAANKVRAALGLPKATLK